MNFLRRPHGPASRDQVAALHRGRQHNERTGDFLCQIATRLIGVGRCRRRAAGKSETARHKHEQTNGEDLVLGLPIRFGMGYGLTSRDFPMGPNEHIAYWGGWGGSTIVVDQDARLCVSYVMNRMESGLMGDPRGFGILQAAYASLAS